jgi:hypothetical protein
MDDKIRNYIEELFKEAPCTKANINLKEEMISNLQEKYTDLIENGSTKELAYNAVISNIGDISPLLDDKDYNDVVLSEQNLKTDQLRRKRLRNELSVVLWSVAIVLYFSISIYSEEWGLAALVFVGAVIIEALINIISD